VFESGTARWRQYRLRCSAGIQLHSNQAAEHERHCARGRGRGCSKYKHIKNRSQGIENSAGHGGGSTNQQSSKAGAASVVGTGFASS
jgi:hypothetical protein